MFAIMWNLGQFLKNRYFANNCLKKFESKSSFAHMWHMLLWLSDAHHISFLLDRFSVRYRFPFPILRFFYRKFTSRALLKDRFLKKMLLKRAKTRRLFFVKL